MVTIWWAGTQGGYHTSHTHTHAHSVQWMKLFRRMCYLYARDFARLSHASMHVFGTHVRMCVCVHAGLLSR